MLKENKIWLGISIRSGAREFIVPSDYDVSTATGARLDKKGNKFIKNRYAGSQTEYRQSPLQLIGNYYTKESYPKYDNYDAINVDKVANIPCDYPGVMGVPLTFMDKYCPEQFEIVGLAGKDGFGLNSFKHYDRYKEMRSNGQPTGSSGKKTNGNPVMEGKTFKGNYFVNISGRIVRSLYSRIFIKNKHPEERMPRKNIKVHVLNKAFDTDVA